VGQADAPLAKRYRQLRIRYERLADMYLPFPHIGCKLICWYFLNHVFC
jgi:hypothetical protein